MALRIFPAGKPSIGPWLASILVLCGAAAGEAHAQVSAERAAIPGHYTVGFYADAQGSSRQIDLGRDEKSFECFVGITGDSTKVFSALVFRLELPLELELDGAIRWSAIPGLKQEGSPLGNGAQIEFNRECQEQRGAAPLMLGRIRFKVAPEFESAVIEPLGHERYGLSVELCDDARVWPKPYANALPLEVRRRVSFWDRITGWFD